MNSATLDHDLSPPVTSTREVSRAFRWVLPCLGALALLLLLGAPVFLEPAEDATILFQYSDNLANTGSISYNTHGPRVEGATDFLWMVVLAGFRCLHVPAFWATALINVGCALLIAAGLFFLSRQFSGKLRLEAIPWMLAVIGGMLFAPPTGAALAGFSVLPFTLLIMAAAICFLQQRDFALALISLLLCLVRPDGVVFAMPLIALRLFSSVNGMFKRSITFALLFVFPGLLYFLWRWHYFGQFLPLPFLVKADTQRFLGIAISQSNIDILKYLVFNAILLPIALGRKLRSAPNLQLLLGIGVVPTMFYLTMRLDQNIADRFFMYLLLCPTILIAWNWHSLKVTRGRLALIAASLWLVLFSYSWFISMTRFLSDGYRNNIVAISRDLGRIPATGTLALSEAGRIAYFSHWPTIDMWGLNTPQFAHRLLQPVDIQQAAPDIVVLYFPEKHDDCRIDPDWKTPYTGRTWPHLAANVITGIQDNGGYDLMMVPSSGYFRRAMHHFQPGAGEYQCWFLKRSSPEYSAVLHILERHDALPGATFLALRFPSPSTTETK
jgi:hypothetical protein